ncbi:MAG TPA: terpene cyclase/mutase family protein, partial [Thermoguttaceae bacterium]|nr:terpene cyclase/mutase family protein [Thermoguttaceae bacterium]
KTPGSRPTSSPQRHTRQKEIRATASVHQNHSTVEDAEAVLPLEISPPPTPQEQWLRQMASQTESIGGEQVRPWWAPMGRKETAGFLTSFVVHLLGIILLAWIWTLPGVRGQPTGQWLGSLDAGGESEELLWASALWSPTSRTILPEVESPPVEISEQIHIDPPWPKRLPSPDAPSSSQQASSSISPVPLSKQLVEPAIRFVPGGGLEARNPQTRTQWAMQRGATQASEDAVERGLRWLAAHQMPNGGWDFDHRKGNCPGLCRNPGDHGCTTAATSLALLAFLGAGYTHQDGPYRNVVHRGFYYLLSRGVKAPRGLDFTEGTMYGHGLATIAICEAYAMTGDPLLKQYAQEAIDFIVYAQDKKGGGWRYQPGQPGDTTVTGWQLMALRSGQMAGLNVPSPSLLLAWRFLDSVQGEQGAVYGYMDAAPRRSTTAIGLLCRMYLGWRPEHPALRRGISHVDQWGPSSEDIYYNYYAAQLMHHWGGPEWKRWNPAMRDYLVRTQAAQGHEAGSWYFDGQHTRPGGRLFSTAAAIMTLEVYYRYLPLYEAKAVQARP